MQNINKKEIKFYFDSYNYDAISKIFNIKRLEAMYMIVDYHLVEKKRKNLVFNNNYNYLLSKLDSLEDSEERSR